MKSRTMKKQSRFLKSVIATAKDAQIRMPFERGATREAFIAKRKGITPALKSA